MLFVVWLLVADGIYIATMGPAAPASAGAFLHDVMTTDPARPCCSSGILVGGAFAALALVVSLVSLPAAARPRRRSAAGGRDLGRVARKNPGPVALWGAIVAAGLALGAVTALLGLALVLPVLGHATWHLYRRAVG